LRARAAAVLRLPLRGDEFPAHRDLPVGLRRFALRPGMRTSRTRQAGSSGPESLQKLRRIRERAWLYQRQPALAETMWVLEVALPKSVL
jgi:hypothetical protein